MSTISSSSSAPPPPRMEEEKGTKKVECVCHYKKDLGKLVITDKMVQFRSLHYEEKIPFEDVISVRKNKSTKVTLKTKNSDSVSFGPFEGIRRGAVYDTVKTILEEKQNAPAPGSAANKSIDLADVKGINDQIVTDVFAAPASAPFSPPIFKESVEKDTVGINEKFAVNMKTLFAIVLSDSSDFSRELHSDRCNDLDLEVGKWSKDPSEAFFVRKLTFRKKQKMVSCSVNQTQRFRLHSPTEAYFETQNVMEGVPFSDCFTVDTIWRWKQESENSTQVNCWIHVDWLKGCWMKGQIEKGSISGTEDYCNNWKLLLLSKFKGDDGSASRDGAASGSSGPAAAGAGKPKASSADNSLITIIFGVGFALFFVISLWLFFSGGGGNLDRIEALETENQLLKNNILELELQLSQHERVLTQRETSHMIDLWRGQLESVGQRLLSLTQEMLVIKGTDASPPPDSFSGSPLSSLSDAPAPPPVFDDSSFVAETPQ